MWTKVRLEAKIKKISHRYKSFGDICTDTLVLFYETSYELTTGHHETLSEHLFDLIFSELFPNYKNDMFK